MSRRRRPGPDNPAQWIGQPYMPEDNPYYLLGMNKRYFRNLPFPWVPFQRSSAKTPTTGKRSRQRSGMHADVAVPGLPAVSKHAKRPAPVQAMPLISNPWQRHAPYYDPTRKQSLPGLALIWLAARYPKGSCLISIFLACALVIGWIWLGIFTFAQSQSGLNLWRLLAAILLFGPILAAFALLLKEPISAVLRTRPRRRRWRIWRRRRG